MDKELPPAERLIGAAWLGLAAALAAVTALYFVLFWKLAFVDMPYNECGSDDCPRGMGWLIIFTPLLWVAAWFVWSRVKDEKGIRTSRPARALALVAALAVLWPGWLAFEWMRGPQMDLSGWQEPVRPTSAKPLGVWPSERSGLLVRARTDGLIAYNGEGRKGWRLPAPDGTLVCALSRTAPSDIGALAYGGPGSACGTKLVAVDLAEGRTLWTKSAPTAERVPPAVVAGTAVIVQEDALVGLDVREGTERWRVKRAPRCSIEALDGARERVLYVEQCERAMRLTAVDARTGAQAWQSPLPPTAGLEVVRVLSADPIAIRNTESVLLFDETGRQRGSVPVSGPEEDLLPAPAPWVRGDLLITPVQRGKKKQSVSAYSLTDGRRLWNRSLDGGNVLGLGPGRGNEVTVVTSKYPWTHLWRLDAGTGRPRQESAILREVPLGQRFEVFPGPPGSYVFVNMDEDGGELPPTFDVDPVRGW
ncbi:PQQ-binding-like beta-propeller repeat protein [Streptomyces sp. NPDC051211]|uniref:outer membrane protein assembly factor BamB family protein n=1 Tax=Streptomyces sp. NPDC051211 TaxID=3154643 RepID=UPI00344CDA08